MDEVTKTARMGHKLDDLLARSCTQFDDGEVASATLRRGSLFCKAILFLMAAWAVACRADYVNPLYLNVASGTLTLEEALAAYNAANGTSYVLSDLNGGALKDWTIVKQGAGGLRSSTGISGFTGAIYVEKGTFYADCKYALGDGCAGAAASGTFVSSGATLYMTSDSTTIYPVEDERITFEGRGVYSNYGALRCDNSDKNAYWGLGRYPVLSGNATIVYSATPTSTRRWGLRSVGEAHDQILDLGGKTLTIQGNYNREWPYFNFQATLGKTLVTNGGSIIATNMTVLLQNAVTFAGDASNEFTLRYARLVIGNYGGVLGRSDCGSIPWTLRVGPESSFHAGGNSVGAAACMTNHNIWKGPVQLSAGVKVSRWSADSIYHSNLSLGGKVSGSGGLQGLTLVALHLTNPENDFTGGVTMKGGTLLASADGAIPADGGAVVLSNSVLHLCGRIGNAYSLPQIELADGSSVVGGTGAAQCVVKTGDGTALWHSQVGGGTLDVRGGTLKFPALRAGLHAGAKTYGPNSQGRQYFLTTTVTNYVSLCPEMAYATSESGCWAVSNTTYTYSGYIWNNGEDTDWTFAASAYNYYVKLDETDVLKMNPSTWGGRHPSCATVRVTKGAHRIVIGLCSGRYDNYMTSYNHLIETSKMLAADAAEWTWDAQSGVMIDRQGRGSKNVADYERLIDPGDGSVFTLTDTRAGAALPDFACLKFAPGARLDFDGLACTVPDVIGLPSVTNGSLTVTGTWTIDAASARAATCAHVDGSITFGEGVTFTVTAGKDDLPAAAKAGGWTLLRAEGGISGLPVEGVDGRKRHVLVKSPDGKSLSLIRFGAFSVIIR